MKTIAITIAAAALATASAAQADHHAGQHMGDGPQTVEKDAKGRPTKVMIEGQTYTVCTADGQDGCINPREAGLKWGNVPLNYWPGKPASEK